ncbi:MAG TPA: sugar transporter [Syntrophobacteraceae bacterium]|nr:sugar transporter [Syntrophobacteraceae bacterium]HBD10099.1 sugar transporter [Syntrophobacteraceae bacterium]HBZ54559.1 sugar transporter [Syntrophobacteraceae bacterium]
MRAIQIGKRTVSFRMILVALCFSLTGCSIMEPAKTARQMAYEPVGPLTLMAGDVVDVKFFYVPELDESQIVRPDGCITLQLIGDVSVVGRVPGELQEELISRYRVHLKRPNITVMVRRVNDSRVWVSGEVKRPGPVQMTGRLTLLEAVVDVGGGVRPTADLRNVLIVRQGPENSYGCLVNLQEVLQGKKAAVFYLQPRDVVYVPPTAITQIDDWIDQYINKLIPKTGSQFAWPIGPNGAGSVGFDTSTR